MVQKRIKNEEYRTIEDFQKGQGSTDGPFSVLVTVLQF